MKNKVFSLLLCAIVSFSCTSKGKVEPIPKLELALLDSVLIENETGLLTKPQFVELIQDSLLVCASFMGGGVWIFDAKTGKELGAILSGNEMGINFFPSAISLQNFPQIEILDGLKGSVLLAELHLNSDDKFTALWKGSIQLETPEGYSTYPVKSYIGKLGKDYIVSLGRNSISQTNPNYFKESVYQFGIFDSLGRFTKYLGRYPEILENLSAPILPYEHFKAFKGIDHLYVVFPSSRSVGVYDENGTVFNQVEIAESRFSDFKPIHLEKELGNMDNPNEKMQSAYFSHLVESERKIYFQTAIRDNSKLGAWLVNSSLMVYDKKDGTWSESDKLYDSWNIGRLAGVVQDTLYFVEASLNNSDYKYIKKAILMPSEK